MLWMDFALGAVLIAAAISGWRSGLIPGVALLAGAVVGLALGGQFGDSVGGTLLGQARYASLVGFALVLGATIAVAALIGQLIQGVAHALWLGWLDRLGGLVLGATVATLVLAALLTAARSSPTAPKWSSEAAVKSRVGSEIIKTGSLIRPLLKDEFKRFSS